MPEIKIKNYKLAWKGEINGKNRSLWIINPESDDLRLWVWGHDFPYFVGDTVRGDIVKQSRTKSDGTSYINKVFIPEKSKKSENLGRLREILAKITMNLNAIKEIQERNTKLLETTRGQLNNLSKLLYEKEFERQLENLTSNRENNKN